MPSHQQVPVLRVGVIGLGMGKVHVEKFAEHPHAEVVAVADADSERLAQRGAALGIGALYTDYQEMLDQAALDIVSIATPNVLHKPIAIDAIQAGCHVLCEKPMALNAAEAVAMKAAADSHGKRLMINFSFRFRPQSFAIKRLIEAGALGDIYYGKTSWMRRRGIPHFGGWSGQKALSGGGPLIDLGVHRLDLALWFMGYPTPKYVVGHTHNHLARHKVRETGKRFDVEDFAAAYLSFPNGASLHLEASWAGNIKEQERMATELLGTKGGVRQVNLNEGYRFDTEFYAEQAGYHYDMKLKANIQTPDPPSAMYHFVDAIVTDTPHMATADEGITIMKILDAIYASADTGAPVYLD